MRALFPCAAVFAATLVCSACGDVGDPLGGPYGGTTSNPGPSGNTSGSSRSDTPSVTTSDDGGTTSKDAGSVSAKDSGASSSDSGTTTTTPTWTDLYDGYLASGTEGRCGDSGCHSQMRSPSNAYTWLQSKNQINGKSSAIGDPSSSVLSWMGGSMPPHGPSSDAASTSAFEAWTAAGAPND